MNENENITVNEADIDAAWAEDDGPGTAEADDGRHRRVAAELLRAEDGNATLSALPAAEKGDGRVRLDVGNDILFRDREKFRVCPAASGKRAGGELLRAFEQHFFIVIHGNAPLSLHIMAEKAGRVKFSG